MVIETIDIMQTAQIEDLETDVEELKDKIALAVADVTALTGKLNDVADDIQGVYEKLMGSGGAGNEYTPSGSPSSDGVLKRVEELYSVFWDHIHMPPFARTTQGFVSSHPPFNTGGTYPTHTTSQPTALAGISQTAVTTYNATASVPAGWATPVSYKETPTKVTVVLGKTKEVRARMLSRKIAKKVKKQWVRRKRRTYN
jgi:hypothetical protein